MHCLQPKSAVIFSAILRMLLENIRKGPEGTCIYQADIITYGLRYKCCTVWIIMYIIRQEMLGYSIPL